MEMNASVRKLIVVQPLGAQDETILHAVIAASFEAAAERIGGCALLGVPRLIRRMERGHRLGRTQTVLLPGGREAEMRWVDSMTPELLPPYGCKGIALYTLGYRQDGVGDHLKAYVFAASVAEVIAMWRGVKPLPHDNELPLHGAVCAKLQFPLNVFREPDAIDRQLAGIVPIDLVYDGPLGLWITRDNRDGLTMYLRRYDLLT